MVRVGLVGVGFMGWIHYLAYQRSQQAELIAFASRDAVKRAGDWRGIQGNFGPPGEQINVDSLNVYASLDDLLADDSIDLIDICTPPHLHVEQVERALRAGKHVLCEKPLALNGDDALRLVATAKEVDRLLLVGHVLPFMSEFKLLADAVADGRWGKILGGHFMRTIGPVDWNPDFYDPQKVGGPLVDLHVHDTHLIRLLFGMPTALHARGRLREGVPQYFEVLYEFTDSNLVVASSGGVIDQHGRPFTHGFEAHFERATVQFISAGFDDGSEAMPLKILHQGGGIERPSLGASDPVDAFVAEINAAAAAIAGVRTTAAMQGELAADALVLSQRIGESIIAGRAIQI